MLARLRGHSSRTVERLRAVPPHLHLRVLTRLRPCLCVCVGAGWRTSASWGSSRLTTTTPTSMRWWAPSSHCSDSVRPFSSDLPITPLYTSLSLRSPCHPLIYATGADVRRLVFSDRLCGAHAPVVCLVFMQASSCVPGGACPSPSTSFSCPSACGRASSPTMWPSESLGHILPRIP